MMVRGCGYPLPTSPHLRLVSEPHSSALGPEFSQARTRFVFRVATLPALIAILLIIPFRVPRELVEVVAVPVVVTVVGVAWLQAGAWRASAVALGSRPGKHSIVFPATALLGLPFVFHLLLKPGIRFQGRPRE
jgi:hypothetical protein